MTLSIRHALSATVRLVTALLLLLGTVGPALAGPPSPAVAATSQPTSTVGETVRLKLLTYNVRQCRRGLDQIVSLLKQQQADIIFLQEVRRAGAAPAMPNQAEIIANRLGAWSVVTADSLNLPKERRCDVAILSRFKLQDGRIHVMAATGNAKASPREGKAYAIQATVEVSGIPLCLLSVHSVSTARLEKESILRTSTLRLAQVNALLDTVRRLDNDVIVAGDFNATPWMPEYHGLTRVLTDLGKASTGSKLTYHSRFPKMRIDYIFGRGDFKSMEYRVLDAKWSDHRPVVSVVEWRPDAVEAGSPSRGSKSSRPQDRGCGDRPSRSASSSSRGRS